MSASHDDLELEIIAAAIRVAGEAPAKQSTHVSYALVYWPLIHELRGALDAAGIDWQRAARKARRGA